ncbi:hypothetical protein NC652_021368 [Populus alba x Populus x berolinensis]|nr:hypothetical protein NC652_021368 [Populus alba x Populus x berolinensis]
MLGSPIISETRGQMIKINSKFTEQIKEHQRGVNRYVVNITVVISKHMIYQLLILNLAGLTNDLLRSTNRSKLPLIFSTILHNQQLASVT